MTWCNMDAKTSVAPTVRSSIPLHLSHFSHRLQEENSTRVGFPPRGGWKNESSSVPDLLPSAVARSATKAPRPSDASLLTSIRFDFEAKLIALTSCQHAYPSHAGTPKVLRERFGGTSIVDDEAYYGRAFVGGPVGHNGVGPPSVGSSDWKVGR